MDDWLLFMLNDTIFTCIDIHFLFWVIYRLLIQIIVYFLRVRYIYIKLEDSAVRWLMAYSTKRMLSSASILYFQWQLCIIIIKFKENYIYICKHAHSKLICIKIIHLIQYLNDLVYFIFFNKGHFQQYMCTGTCDWNFRNFINWIILLHNNECLVWMKPGVISWIIWETVTNIVHCICW